MPVVSLMPWPVLTALAAVVTVVAGLVPPIALASVGWAQAPDIGFWSMIALGTRGWLLAHGAGVPIASGTLTIVPLGVTALALLTGSGVAGLAAAQARQEAAIELSQRERRALALRVGGVFAAAYVVCILFASALTDTANQTGRALLGGLLVGLVSGVVGAGRAVDWHPTAWWPEWAKAVPRAILAAICVMVACGAVVAVVALLRQRHNVMALYDALVPGTAGGLVLLLLQLAWLPNLVLWCGSWALGAGFSVGTGTLVSPAHNLTGMLPAIPVLGAIGPNGPGPRPTLLWLLSGVLAGGIAAAVVVRSRRAARFDETALVGGLSGVLAGLTFWLLAVVSNGSLGDARLVGVGARLLPLLVMAPTVMGISGLVVGLVMGWLRQARAGRDAAQDGEADPTTGDGVDEEATTSLDLAEGKPEA
ncbi:cell division protein PerM [Luteococcus japonicus]|uniref:Putative integral membrane protein n=2 Tax=Luteococcus TaxID=33983 RepID=A0A1R4IX30_9ACTN|nr:DUF6350 family protein [Luteococcus japonicus]SJN24249.1 putative integral membrane protein [Luteococcus japonicus LSP_Lj1]